MAEDRTPRTISLTKEAASEPEDERQKREHHHRRRRNEPDRREQSASPERRFPGRNEHESAVSKLL